MAEREHVRDLASTYQRDGYVVARGVVPRDEILALRAHAEQLVLAGDASPAMRYTQTAYDRAGGVRLIKISSLAENDARFHELATRTRLVDLVEALIGPGARRFRDVLVIKPARTGGALSYHQDSAYWDVEPKALCSCWIALGDVSERSSCLRVVPGTHRELTEHGLFLRGRHEVPRVVTRGLRRLVSLAGTGDNPDASGSKALWKLKRLVLTQATRYAPMLFDLQDFRVPPAAIDARDEVLLSVAAGDVVFFHSLLWHASGPNETDATRMAEILSFMSADARYMGRGGDHFPDARTE